MCILVCRRRECSRYSRREGSPNNLGFLSALQGDTQRARRGPPNLHRRISAGRPRWFRSCYLHIEVEKSNIHSVNTNRRGSGRRGGVRGNPTRHAWIQDNSQVAITSSRCIRIYTDSQYSRTVLLKA